MKFNFSQNISSNKKTVTNGGFPPPPEGFAYLSDEDDVTYVTSLVEGIDTYIIVAVEFITDSNGNSILDGFGNYITT